MQMDLMLAKFYVGEISRRYKYFKIPPKCATKAAKFKMAL